MAKPPLPLIVKWRDLAQEGRFYTDIAKDYPDYTVSQHHPPRGVVGYTNPILQNT